MWGGFFIAYPLDNFVTSGLHYRKIEPHKGLDAMKLKKIDAGRYQTEDGRFKIKDHYYPGNRLVKLFDSHRWSVVEVVAGVESLRKFFFTFKDAKEYLARLTQKEANI